MAKDNLTQRSPGINIYLEQELPNPDRRDEGKQPFHRRAQILRFE